MAGVEIVRVEGLSKRFVLHKDKSIKERLVNVARSQRHRMDFWALRDIDLSVDAGTTMGLVGHNGSGKSTLLKVIGGIIQPSAGSVSRRGRLAALLELGAGFHPDLTGRENVYLNASILGLTRQETDRYFDAIVDFSGIEEFIDTQVKFYSSGMYVRLAFAVAVHVDPDILLVDEVLAVGDEPFQKKCMEKIAEFQKEGRTILLVSHSSAQVASLCDRVAVLDHGSLEFDGDPAEGLQVLRRTFDRADGTHERSLAEADGPAIRSVVVSANERGMDGGFAAGSDLRISVNYSLDRAPAGWIMGIDIQNGYGQAVYRVNSQGLGIDLPVEAGRYSLDIELPRNPFAGGRYLVSASSVTAEGLPLDRLEEPTSFDIEMDTRGAGLVQFDAAGRVQRLDA